MNEQNAPAPVFVLGCPRSGTSVLSWAIAQHAEYWTSAESDFIIFLFGQNKLHEAFKKAVARPDMGWLKKNNVGYKEFAAHIGHGLERIFSSRSKGKAWVDASPGHTLMADDLALLFPEARFVHILRDGRAVVNSMVNSKFDQLDPEEQEYFQMPWISDFSAACETWAHYAEQGRAFMEKNPDRCIEVLQEDLAGNPRELFEKLFAFLNSDFCEKSVEFVSSKRINSSFDPGSKTTSSIDAEENPFKKKVWDSWSEEMNDQFDKIARPTLIKMGYDV